MQKNSSCWVCFHIAVPHWVIDSDAMCCFNMLSNVNQWWRGVELEENKKVEQRKMWSKSSLHGDGNQVSGQFEIYLIVKERRFHFQVPDFAGTRGKLGSAFVSFFSYFVYGNSCDIFLLIILWLRYARYLIRSKVQVVAHGSTLVIFTFTIPDCEGFCLLVTPHLLFTTQENGHIPCIDTIRLY